MIPKSEIIQRAFSRGISETHIKDADITAAIRKFVYPYIPVPLPNPLPDKVKNVIAYGVAWIISDRLALEVSDRGVVAMVTQGTAIASEEAKLKAKNEIMRVLVELIKEMTASKVTYAAVDFKGVKTIGAL